MISKRLQIVIDKLGWSQERLASEIVTSPSTVSRWLGGKMPPSKTSLRRIAQTCGVSLGWLVSGEGYMIPPPPIKYEDASPDQRREHNESVAVRDKMIKDPAWDYPAAPLTEEENAKVTQGEVITRKVLTSRTKFSKALWENLKAFESAVDTEEEMKGMKEEMAEMKAMIREIRDNQISAAGHEKKGKTVNGSSC